VKIVEREEGPFLFVYRTVPGIDQRKIGAVTSELYNVLTRAGIQDVRPLDVFHPSAENVPNEIGFEVPVAQATKLASAEGYYQNTIPRRRYMTTTFPFRNRLSFMVAYVKVDPALNSYRQRKAYRSAWAMARNDGETITYFQPAVPATP